MSTSTRQTKIGHSTTWVVAAVLAVVVAMAVVAVVATSGGADGRGDGATASADAAFGSVAVDGPPLPTYADGDDRAIGQAAPAVRGTSPSGQAISVGGGDEPTVVVFLAHWCPHCQREVPLLVGLAEQGLFDGVRLVAVATGTDDSAPNFPPAAWLEREGWPGEVLLDDRSFTAAQAYGLAGYPFAVYLDPSGRVVDRTSGETPADTITQLVGATEA